MAKRKCKIKLWVKLLLFLVVFSVGFYFINTKVNIIDFGKNDNNNKTVSKSKSKKQEPKETKKEYKLSMIMAGDALMHGYLNTDAKQSDGSYNYMNQFRYVKEYVKDYDLRYWNQETIFGGTDRPYSGYPRFNTPSALGDNLIDDMGFNIVSTANNHSMDQNTSGVLNSVAYWKTKDILWNGTADSEETRNTFITKEKNNITYGLLSYTDHTNGLPVPSDKPYLVNVWNEDQAKKDISELRGKVDVLMVAMHWGIEYTHSPVESQKKQAQFLAEQGVDIIIGCHPHVIEPIEIIETTNEETGEKHKTVVFYSLGNFISNQTDENTRVGLFGTLDITKTVDKGTSTITIDNVGGELHYTHRDLPSHRNYVVIPFSNPDIAKYLPNYKTAYEKYKNIVTQGNEEIKIVPLNEEGCTE